MIATTLLTIALALAAAPSPTPPPPRLPAGARGAAGERVGTPTLTRRGDGSYEHRDRVAGFAARIHPDGRVTFRDLSPIRVASPTVLGFDLLGRAKEPPDETFNQRSNTLVHRGAHTDTKTDPLVKWGPYGAGPILVDSGGTFAGVSDLATSTRRANAKRKFLDQTAELRARMSAETRRTNEKHALAKLGGDLKAIWADGTTPLSLRKERLFVRWDECEEQLVDTGHDDPEEKARARAGAAARRQIEAFIRRQAPSSTADAFTPGELRDMNARRRSRAKFDPYRDEAPAIGPVPAR
jgi:hypothetical protein